MRRTAHLPAALLLTALVLTGCTTPTPMPTAPPEPSIAPVFASDEEALAAAEEAYGRYVAAAQSVIHRGGQNPEAVEPYLSAELYERDRQSFEKFRENSWVGVGDASFTMLLQQYDDHSVHTYVCDDFSKTDVHDTTGVSVVSPDRRTRFAYEVEFAVADQMRIVNKDLWDGSGVC